MRESGIYQMYLKNLLDRLLALVGTAALSWLLILLGIAIHLDSPGPIFFRQKRAGKNGTYFYIYKFRTMRMDTPHDMPTHMLNNPDLFITRVGRFLRKTSLDELPIQQKAELDGYYVHHIQLKMDLECLWRTAGAVLRQDGIHEGRLEKQQMQGAKEAVKVGK